MLSELLKLLKLLNSDRAEYQLSPEYYILKVNDFNRWSKVPLEQWIYFLSTSDIPEDADAPGLKAAREKLQLSQMSREEQAAYRRYWDDRVILADQIYTAKGEGRLEGRAEGFEEGHAKGRAEGRAEGRADGEAIGAQKNAMDNARKMQADNMPVELIAKYTGLTVEEIERL